MYKLESVTLAYWQTGVTNSLIAVTNSAFNVSSQDCVQLVHATVSLFQTKIYIYIYFLLLNPKRKLGCSNCMKETQ